MNIHENVRDSCLIDRLTILELANVTEEDLLRAELDDLVEINIDSDSNFDSDSDDETDFEARDAYIGTVDYVKDQRESSDLPSNFEPSVTLNESESMIVEDIKKTSGVIAYDDREKATKKVSYFIAKSEEENIRHKLSILREAFFQLQEEHARYKFYHFAQKKLSVDTMRDLELQIANLEKELTEKIAVSNSLYSPEFDSVDRGTTTMTPSEEYEEVKKLLTKQLKIVAYSIDIMVRKTRDIQYEIDNSLLMTANYRQTLMEMMITNNERVTVLKDYQRKLHKQMTSLLQSFPIFEPTLKMARIKEYWKGDEALLVSMRASILHANDNSGYASSTENQILPTEQRLLDSINLLEEEKKKIKLRMRSHDQGKITPSLVDLEVKISMAKVFFHKTRCLSMLNQLDNLYSPSLQPSSSDANEDVHKEKLSMRNKLSAQTVDRFQKVGLQLKEEIQAMILIQSNLECFLSSIPIFRRKSRGICVEAIQSSKQDVEAIKKQMQSITAWGEFLEPIFSGTNMFISSKESNNEKPTIERKNVRRFSLFDGPTAILTASTGRLRSKSVSSASMENLSISAHSERKNDKSNNKIFGEENSASSKVDIEMNSRQTNPDIDELVSSPISSPLSGRPTKGINTISPLSKSANFGLLSFHRSKENTNPVISQIDTMINQIRRGMEFSSESLPLGVKSIIILQEEMDHAKHFCKKELQNALERLRKIPFFHIHQRNEAHEDHLSIALRERQLLDLCAQSDQLMTQFVLPSISIAMVEEVYSQAIFDEIDIFTYVLGFLRSHLLWQGKSPTDRESMILKNEHIQLFHDGLETKIRNIMDTARSSPTVQEGVGHVFPCYDSWFTILQMRRDIEHASTMNRHHADPRGMVSLVMDYKHCQRIWESSIDEFEDLQMEYEYWMIVLLLARCRNTASNSVVQTSATESSLTSDSSIVYIHEDIRVHVDEDGMGNHFVRPKSVPGRGSDSSIDSAEEEQAASEGFGLFFQPLALELFMEELTNMEDIVSRCASTRQKLSTSSDKLLFLSKCPILYRHQVEQYLRLEDTVNRGFESYVVKSIQEIERYNELFAYVSSIKSDEERQELFSKIQQFAISAYYRCVLHYQHWNRVYLKALSEIQTGNRLIEDFGRTVSVFESGFHRCQCPRYERKCLQILKRIEQYERVLVLQNNQVAVSNLSDINYSLYWEKSLQQYHWYMASRQEQPVPHASNSTFLQQNEHSSSTKNSGNNRGVVSRATVNSTSPMASGSRKSLPPNPASLTTTSLTNPMESIHKLRRMNNGLDRNRYLLMDAVSHFSPPASSVSHNQQTLPSPRSTSILRFRDDTLHFQELALQLSIHMNLDAFLLLWQRQQQQQVCDASEATMSLFASSASITSFSSSSFSSQPFLLTHSDTLSSRPTDFLFNGSRDTTGGTNSSVASRRRTVDHNHLRSPENVHNTGDNSNNSHVPARSRAWSVTSFSLVSQSKPSTVSPSHKNTLITNNNHTQQSPSSATNANIQNVSCEASHIIMSLTEFNQCFG